MTNLKNDKMHFRVRILGRDEISIGVALEKCPPTPIVVIVKNKVFFFRPGTINIGYLVIKCKIDQLKFEVISKFKNPPNPTHITHPPQE